MQIKDSMGRKVFVGINTILLLFIGIVTLYPMLYVIFASFSNASQLMAHEGALLHPLGWNLDSYKAVFKNSFILTGYLNSIFIMAAGTAVNLVATTVAAYFFSRSNVMHKKVLMQIVMFTMFFNGGLVPTYLWLKDLGFLNNYLVLILPGAISVTNMLIMRTAMYAVPPSLEENARLDGAGHFVVLTKIFVPLIMPTIAVIALYSVVGHWNSWFNASIYITDRGMYPLQLVLREILIVNETSDMLEDATVADAAQISETIKYAVIVVATVPILCLHPFLQKYFVNGVMIGAVKE